MYNFSHIRLIVFFCCIIIFSSFLSFGQSEKKLYKKAKKFFDNENFVEALPIFLKIDTTDEKDDFFVKYYIGACFLNTKYQKTKGIPYLEFAIKNGEKYLPKDIFLDLTRLYHLNYQFHKSEKMLKEYFKLARKEDSINIKEAHILFSMDSLAITLQKDSEQYEVSALPYPINTNHSENMAFISADNNILFFTRTYHRYVNNLLKDSTQQIMMSVKKNDYWSSPQLISVTYDKKKFIDKPQLIGISFDAQYLFFKVYLTKNNSDLFVGKLYGNKCHLLESLPEEINSPFAEGAISFTPDGKTCYFSSNRPGGYGGMDLYVSKKINDHKWSKAKNLGAMINSAYNENYPFIHPSGKRLYFSSDNIHKVIGGYDIFVSDFSTEIGDWSEPNNMSFPINTPVDDISFVPNAEGNLAYYSSSKGNEQGCFNIYVVRLEQTIPLTLIKGFIYEEKTKKPIAAQITVYNSDNNKKIKYVYNPNPETGKYLMIFPPGKNYQMVIQAKGYHNYLVEIHVPHQNYFYELYQEIVLKPIIIKSEKKKLGEIIEVNNIFYDTERFFKGDTLEIKKGAQSKNYSPLLNLVNNIISLTDSMGLEYINNMYAKENQKTDSLEDYKKLLSLVEGAINTTDSALLEKINKETIYKEKTKQCFYYNPADSIQFLSTKIFGSDTFFIASFVNTIKYKVSTPFEKFDSLTEYAEKQKIVKTIDTVSFFFMSGKFNISQNDITRLSNVINFLLENPSLSVSVIGHTDSDGSKEKNLELSYKRAFEISRILKSKNIDKKRIHIKGVGEPAISEKTKKEKQHNRRVDIIIKEEYFE